MKIDAMLCDFAEAHANKLFISGAAINLLGTPSPQAPHPVGVWVGLLITIPWQATNQLHTLRMTLEDQDGTRIPLANAMPGLAPDDAGAIIAQFNMGRAPMMQTGEDSLMPVALPLNAALPHLGPFAAVFSINGSEMTRLHFRLMTLQNPFGGALPAAPGSVGPSSIPGG